MQSQLNCDGHKDCSLHKTQSNISFVVHDALTWLQIPPYAASETRKGSVVRGLADAELATGLVEGHRDGVPSLRRSLHHALMGLEPTVFTPRIAKPFSFALASEARRALARHNAGLCTF